MKEKIIFIIDRIVIGLVFIAIVSLSLCFICGAIYALMLCPIQIILIFTVLFIIGYFVQKLGIIK